MAAVAKSLTDEEIEALASYMQGLHPRPDAATAAAIAEAGDLDVVMDRCVKIEHARFHGGLHLAGFNTGEITSRKQRVSARR